MVKQLARGRGCGLNVNADVMDSAKKVKTYSTPLAYLTR